MPVSKFTVLSAVTKSFTSSIKACFTIIKFFDLITPEQDISIKFWKVFFALLSATITFFIYLTSRLRKILQTKEANQTIADLSFSELTLFQIAATISTLIVSATAWYTFFYLLPIEWYTYIIATIPALLNLKIVYDYTIDIAKKNYLNFKNIDADKRVGLIINAFLFSIGYAVLNIFYSTEALDAVLPEFKHRNVVITSSAFLANTFLLLITMLSRFGETYRFHAEKGSQKSVDILYEHFNKINFFHKLLFIVALPFLLIINSYETCSTAVGYFTSFAYIIKRFNCPFSLNLLISGALAIFPTYVDIFFNQYPANKLILGIKDAPTIDTSNLDENRQLLFQKENDKQYSFWRKKTNLKDNQTIQDAERTQLTCCC